MVLSCRPSLLIEDLTLSARIFRRSLFVEETARKYDSTQFGHCYAIVERLASLNDPVLLAFPTIYRMRPQNQRPLWTDFPRDLDGVLRDYLLWLGEQAGVPLSPDEVLSENHAQFRQSLRSPVRFVLDHWRAAFHRAAWRYLFNRIAHAARVAG